MLGEIIQRNDARTICGAYLIGFLKGQFGITMPFVARIAMGLGVAAMTKAGGCPLLLSHVDHVVSVRAKEKVAWPNASPVVASVEHEHTRRNRSYSQAVSNSMSRLVRAMPAANPYGAILATFCAFPDPAVICLFNFVPKAISHRDLLHFRHNSPHSLDISESIVTAMLSMDKILERAHG